MEKVKSWSESELCFEVDSRRMIPPLAGAIIMAPAQSEMSVPIARLLEYVHAIPHGEGKRMK